MIDMQLIMFNQVSIRIAGEYTVNYPSTSISLKYWNIFPIKSKTFNIFWNFMWKNSGLSNNFDGLFPNHLSGSGLKFRINESILHWKNPFPLNSVRIPNIPDYRGPDYRNMTVNINFEVLAKFLKNWKHFQF